MNQQPGVSQSVQCHSQTGAAGACTQNIVQSDYQVALYSLDHSTQLCRLEHCTTICDGDAAFVRLMAVGKAYYGGHALCFLKPLAVEESSIFRCVRRKLVYNESTGYWPF